MTATVLDVGPAPARAAPAGSWRGARAPGWSDVGSSAATAVVATAVAMLPVLVPAGPGNTGPVDVVIACAVGVVALHSLASRTLLHLPYWVPVVVLIAAGGLAGLHQGRAVTSGTALLQDVILLLWGGAVASVACQPLVLRRLVQFWVATAVCWAGVLVVAVNAGVDSVAGISSNEGGRASLTFGDPNRAGCYFVLSFLLMRAAQWPHRRRLRWSFGSLLLLAMAFTGSNAALVSLVVACLFGAGVHFWRRHGWVALIALVGVVSLPVLYLAASINVTALQKRARDGGRILANSVARSDQGASDRELLLSENLALYRAHDVQGAGPGGTKELLREEQAAYVKEAHNDYLAALLERGALGAVGLVLLWAAVLARCLPLCARAPNRSLLAAVPRPELLVGAAIAAATFGWFHEAMHFRHVWAVLGLVAAASLIATTPTPAPRPGGTT
jgi:O-antigen ligase